MNDMNLLIRRAKHGDAHAFALLYQTIYRDLYRFAFYTLRHPQDAEDAVAETVADAFAQIGSLREAAAFHAWIFRILTAKCSHRIREYTKRERELDESILHDDESAIIKSNDLEETIDTRRAFALLSEEDRLILSMHLFAGYSSQEIGEILKLNANTVRSRQSRALKRLEALLQS